MKKVSIIAPLIMAMIFAPTISANPASAAARAAQAMNAARQAQAIRVANAARETARINQARIVHTQQINTTRKALAVKKTVQNQATAKHTEFLRVNAQQAKVNQQNLRIAAVNKAALDQGVKARIGASSMKRTDVFNNVANSRVRAFNNNANPQLVYSVRINPKSTPNVAYTGQTKGLGRYPVRQGEHIANHKSPINHNSTWTLVGAAPQGNPHLLRYVEQASIQAHKSNAVGLTLTNKISAMAAPKFSAQGGDKVVGSLGFHTKM